MLVEGSSAFIQGNAVFGNVKANIALGGRRAEDTVIIGNKIFGGSSEGIFVMLCGNCIIYNNHIFENYDGIVVMEATPEISYNEVYDNKNNGIHVLRGSVVTMRVNSVHNNEGIGILMREKAYGEIVDNQAVDNEVDLAVEYYSDWVTTLVDKNEFSKEVRLPQKESCTLI